MDATIYIAGTISEYARADAARKLLPGHCRTMQTWIDGMMARPDAKDSDLTPIEATALAQQCFREVESARLLWLLFPEVGGRGAFIEFGYACHAGKLLVVSGANYHKSVFARLASCHYDDRAAAEFIGRLL